MDSLIQQLTDNPILLAVALILVAAVVYTLVKRLVKLALFLLVLMAVYIGYLVMTEQELPEELQKGKEFIEEIAIFTYGFYDLGEETWKDMLEKFGLNEDEILWLFIPIFLIIFAIAYVMQRKAGERKAGERGGKQEIKNKSCFILYVPRFSWNPQVLPWLYANRHNTASNRRRLFCMGAC